MSFKLCTSGAIVIKAGAYPSDTAKASAAILQQFSDEAEGYINAITRFDWVANYDSVLANFKPVLADAASCLAGAYVIAYDMSGYTSRGEAESMNNILYDRATRAIEALRDEKLKTKAGVPNQ